MRTTISLLATAALAVGSFPAAAQNGRPPPLPRNPSSGSAPQIGQPVNNADKATDAAMTGMIAYKTYKWQNGQPPVQLPSPKTHLCMLTMVSGKFAGMGERVALYIDSGAPGGARWALNGTSGQTELQAQATCVEWVAFGRPAGAPPMQATGGAALASTGCKPVTRALKPDDKYGTPFLSGVAGRFSGLGEGAKVSGITGFMGINAGTLEVKACSSGIDATPVMVSSPAPLKFRTLSARTPNIAQATMGFRMDGMKSSSWTDFFTPWNAGGEDLRATDGSVWLVPADEAVCGLVEISGKLQGYGEVVALYVDKREGGRRWWRLRVGTQADDTSIFGAARCLARDQR